VLRNCELFATSVLFARNRKVCSRGSVNLSQQG
jgi:hypothetical protein